MRLLLTTASDHHPDSQRREAAQQLVGELFPRPVHAKRWPSVLDRTRDPEEAQETVRRRAEELLIEAVWEEGQERSWPWYNDLLDRLRKFLNRRVTQDILGPAWRRREPRGKNEGKTQERQGKPLEVLVSPDDLLRQPASGDPEKLMEARLELERHHRRIERQAQQLTDVLRSVYLLVERDGFTPSEAAEELDIPPSTARSRLQRARKAIQKAS